MTSRSPWGSVRRLPSGRYQARYRVGGVEHLEGMLVLLADDYVFIDHRPASFGTFDRQGWVTLAAALFDMVESQYLLIESIDIVGSVAMMRTRETAQGSDGKSIEISTSMVACLEGERFVRFEFSGG